jgi:hypothetical protein
MSCQVAQNAFGAYMYGYIGVGIPFIISGLELFSVQISPTVPRWPDSLKAPMRLEYMHLREMAYDIGGDI